MKAQAHQQALIRAPRANQAAARVLGNVVRFETMPYWLSTATGASTALPFEIDLDEDRAHPLIALAVVARDMAAYGFQLHDYLMEFPGGSDEQRLCILADGMVQRSAAGEGNVLFQLRDVSEIVQQRRRAAAIGAYHALIGRSLRMLEVYRRIALYAPTESPVIVTGETGTGKELVARAIHDRSKRAEGPFVPVNCTALTPELFESELFGHEKGAFTGAIRQHKGRFERADGGTLFLDEIGDMPLITQAKLLRALEEGVIERVGSEEMQRVDVRVVAATNVALEAAVAAGRFRADLYHRISVLRIHLAPLRERTGDIPLLVEHLIEVFNRRYDRNVQRFTPEALRLLEDYTWPGNIRELRNVVERLFVETEGEAIGAKALSGWISERDFLMPGDWNADALFQPRPPIIPQTPEEQGISMPTSGYFPGGQPVRSTPRPALPFEPAPSGAGGHTPFDSFEPITIPEDQVIFEAGDPPPRPPRKPKEITADVLRRAFRDSEGNITQAAHSLGLHKATFYRHMKQLGISRDDLDAPPGDEGTEETE